MKRTFLQRRNALLVGALPRAGAIVLALALLLALVRFVFPGVFLAFSAPLFRVSDAVDSGFQSFFNGFGNARALREANIDLTQSLAEAKAQNLVLSAQLSDFTALAGKGSKNADLIAGVIARPPVAPYDTLVLGAGSADGVVAGDVAFAPGGIPLGVIDQVSASAARVALYSASGTKTDAWLGAAHTPVTLVGQGGGSFLITLSRSVDASTTELVYVSGPGALPIGTVAAVESDPSSPSVTLKVANLVNFSSLPYVLVRHAAVL